MEKNLPFISVPLVDQFYNKLIIPFLGKLDDGNIFKNIITLLFSVFAIILLLGGIYLCLEGTIGDRGFIENYITNDFISTGKKIGAVIGLIIGFVVSIITVWILYSVVKKRSEQMNALEYDSLLSFVFVKTIPKFILIVGELTFVLFLYIGVLQIISAVIGSYIYAPLSGYPDILLSLFPGMELILENSPRQIAGDYDHFGYSIVSGMISLIISFFVLITFYIYKEIYNYLLKIVTNLIAFLPKFAIPIAIRKRVES